MSYRVKLEWSDGACMDTIHDSRAENWRAACSYATDSLQRVKREIAIPVAGVNLSALAPANGWENEWLECERLLRYFDADRLPKNMWKGSRTVDRVGDYTLTIENGAQRS